ncbi:phosphoribosylamine--glycine ligase [Marihabitans asiaticum]|uniref:Phosphoribosylamine--glycine ligase n=1 Tax=Marihabitans asiaticum TaxID=415218 RepID=A0A560WHJ5_9MICO|nr:phosphoribosylamine--glycine ligase [Marihabitans asiaticum]TWD16925.1 phosphoribosylamine--glycine ligase [Marihabitans asiaticum]
MKVLVIGSGAREHAVVRSLVADPAVDAVICAPGNPGIDLVALCVPVDPTDPDAVVALAREHQVDLVVVGPEAPLVAGVGDALRAADIPCFGPDRAAAHLEGSKAFAKEVMAAAEVPTGMAHVATTEAQLAEALDAFGPPFVVKDDGLAAGKGVVVTDDREEALAHGRECLAKGAKGGEGRVVVEEFLDGPEASLFCLCDGTSVVPLELAQDFKRVFDGDEGPNTGGMGAYSPLPWAPDGLVSHVVERIAQPVVEEMARRGTPFVGVLYVGLALTSRGPRVIEFNARFGDPETQSVLARLSTPLGGLLLAAAQGRLDEAEPLQWRDEAAVTVVVAAGGYPQSLRTGDVIEGIDRVGVGADDAQAYVLHAGTAAGGDGQVVSSGGRVLSVIALGDDLAAARAAAYAAVEQIELEGSHHRTDIALRASRDEIRL